MIWLRRQVTHRWTFVALTASLFGAIVACGPRGSNAPVATGDVAYAEHVATIVDQKCCVCHRDNGAGPFSLTTYAHVADRATQIVDVTASRYMPPWLPATGDHPFAGDRRLSEAELTTLRRWSEAGAPRGASELRPAAPTWTSEWSLGEPDLIVPMQEAYVRQADARDTWRNFVLAVPLDKTAYVRAVDFDAGNPKLVHHAVIEVDATQGSRALDEADAAYGFDGMRGGSLSLGPFAENPDGHFIGWTPGKVPYPGDPSLAWRLEPGSDLILQLHMPATGKDESIRSRVALYFSQAPPEKFPFSLLLSARSIDIPPGDTDHQIQLQYQLPIDCQLLSVYPHAHYLCRKMLVEAALPGGPTRVLLDIPDWNFDWQDEYRFAHAVQLPRGTLVRMSYRFDNSDRNLRNPNQPPKRVAYGEQSTDEMADLVLQVLPASEPDRKRLSEHFLRYQYEQSLQHHLWALRHRHAPLRHHNGAAEAYLLLNQPQQAVPHLKSAISLDAADQQAGSEAHVHAKLAMAYSRLNQRKLAISSAKRAAAAAPRNNQVQHQMGIVLQTSGEPDQAIACYQRALQMNPQDVASRINLGILWGRAGKVTKSIRILQEAVALQPSNAVAHLNLGISLRADGRIDEAVAELRQAVQLDPHNQAAHRQLESTRKKSR